SGTLHAFQADGTEAPGFPVGLALSRFTNPNDKREPVHASIFAPIAAGDLDADGKTEIVAVSIEGQINVVRSDGTIQGGFPVALPFPDMSQASPRQVIGPGAIAAPALADLDRNGTLDIIVAGLD